MHRMKLLGFGVACLFISTAVGADDFVEVWFQPGLDRANREFVKVRVTDFSIDEEKKTVQLVYELMSDLAELPSSYLPPPDIPHIRVIVSYGGDKKISLFRVDKPVDCEDTYVQKWLEVYQAAWDPVEKRLGSSPLTSGLNELPDGCRTHATHAPLN